MKYSHFQQHITLLIFMILLFGACSSLQQAGGDSAADTDEPDSDALSSEEAKELQLLLNTHRSYLADLQSPDELVVPSVFTQEATATATTTGNPYQGYRIQLISTRNVQEADSLSNDFQDWIESETDQLQYPAQSYVLFRQPYYRVHVGDFQDKSQAVRFTKIIKKKYPDAWVVPDRIIPANIPSDSTPFTIEEDSTESTADPFN